MALITEEQKEQLKNFVGSDGKIVAPDSMPEDLKKAIEFINVNNIDIFSGNYDAEEIDDEPVSEEEDFQSEEENAFEPAEELEQFDDAELNDSEAEELGEFL